MFFLAVLFLLFAILFLVSAIEAGGKNAASRPSDTSPADRIERPDSVLYGEYGESMLYQKLTKEYMIPENQILRNVYIPTGKGSTSEIDMIAVSKKGLFIFECKNFGGNIYGDAEYDKWIQYIGAQKNFFNNPFKQNAIHASYLRKFLKKIGEVPIISIVYVTDRAKWNVRNLGQNDYLLDYNVDFRRIYNHIGNSDVMMKNYWKIYSELRLFSDPESTIKARHVQRLKSREQQKMVERAGIKPATSAMRMPRSIS